MSQLLPAKPEPTQKPPYLSYRTFRNFLESLGASGIPGRIDRSFMPSSMSGANQVLVIAALKFLKLIDENGIPQDNLHKLIEEDGSINQAAYYAALNSAYSFLLNDLDIERATTRQVEEKFKDLGLSSDTIRKAVNFFMLAAKDADMKISPHIKPYQGSGRNGGGQRQRKATARPEEETRRDATPKETPVPSTVSKTPYQVLIEILSPDMEEAEQDAVWTLIRYLKKREANQ